MREELRVQIHLAEMEAKATWEKLQPRLKDLGRKAARAGSAAQAEIDGALRKLRASLRDLSAHVEDHVK
jgi:hypothetical protein